MQPTITPVLATNAVYKIASRKAAKLQVAFITYTKPAKNNVHLNCAAFVPDLVPIYMNGLDEGAEQRPLHEKKLTESEAVAFATYKLPLIPENDHGEYVIELEKCVESKLNKIYNYLHKQQIALPPQTPRAWLKKHRPINRWYDVNFGNPIDMAGILPGSYAVHNCTIEIEHYKASWWEKFLPKVAFGVSLSITLSTLATIILELAVSSAIGLLPTTLIFGLGYLWFIWDDYLDKANKTARDINRFCKGQYHAPVGHFSPFRSFMTLCGMLITSGVALREGWKTFMGANSSLIAYGLAASIASGIAYFLAITVTLGVFISLGYSLTLWFGFTVRHPQFKIANTPLEKRPDLFEQEATFSSAEVKRLLERSKIVQFQSKPNLQASETTTPPLTPRLSAKAQRAGLHIKSFSL